MLINSSRRVAIIGCGGCARDIACNLKKNSYDFFVNKEYLNKEYLNKKLNNIYSIEEIDFDNYDVLLGIGDPFIRKKIISEFPENVNYVTYIDKHVKLLDPGTINIGKGSVICAGTILTSNITIGDFSQINLQNTISHDCNLGDFFTTAPGVNISGNVNSGHFNYYGTNCAIKNNINITNNVTIGMNSNVIKDIATPGTYVGNPLKKIY